MSKMEQKRIRKGYTSEKGEYGQWIDGYWIPCIIKENEKKISLYKKNINGIKKENIRLKEVMEDIEKHPDYENISVSGEEVQKLKEENIRLKKENKQLKKDLKGWTDLIIS